VGDRKQYPLHMLKILRKWLFLRISKLKELDKKNQKGKNQQKEVLPKINQNKTITKINPTKYVNSVINTAKILLIRITWTCIYGESVQCFLLALIALRLLKYPHMHNISLKNVLNKRNSENVLVAKNQF